MTTDTMSPFAGMDFTTLLVRQAKLRGDRAFLIWAPFDAPERVWTYAAFADDVARLAGGLRKRGIERGDRILVHLENCPETLIARAACAWIGAVAVVTNAMAVGPELAAMAELTGVRAAITQPRFAPVVQGAVPRLDWIAVTAHDAGAAPSQDIPEDLLRYDDLAAEPLPPQPAEPSAPALILFTTGTTAHAKAVLWTHENLLWGASLGAQQQGFRQSDVGHLFLPLFHVVGFSWTFLPLLWIGGTVVLQPRFSASRFWPVATAHKATVSAHVPFTLKALEEHEVPAAHDFRFWITNRQIPAAQQKYRIPEFVSSWGMTEMVSQPVTGTGAHADLSADVIGRPSSGYSIRIVDESGRQVKPGEAGELLVGGVRGRSVFLEYLGNAEATAESFDENGYFCTGDLVHLLEDGSIRFAERLKDVIKVGGEGVSAGEIEATIAQLDAIAEVAVVPRPDPFRGEIPVAFVVLTAACTDTPETVAFAIKEHCRQRLARFKLPQDIRFIEALPRVGFGKIAKGKLKAMSLEGKGESQ